MTKLYKATFNNYDFNGDGISDKFYITMKFINRKTVTMNSDGPVTIIDEVSTPVSYSADISGRGSVNKKTLEKEFGLKKGRLGIAFKADTKLGGYFDGTKDNVDLFAIMYRYSKNAVRLSAEQLVTIDKNSNVGQKLSKLKGGKEWIYINSDNLETSDALNGDYVSGEVVPDGKKKDNKWRIDHWWHQNNLPGVLEEIK